MMFLYEHGPYHLQTNQTDSRASLAFSVQLTGSPAPGWLASLKIRRGGVGVVQKSFSLIERFMYLWPLQVCSGAVGRAGCPGLRGKQKTSWGGSMGRFYCTRVLKYLTPIKDISETEKAYSWSHEDGHLPNAVYRVRSMVRNDHPRLIPSRVLHTKHVCKKSLPRKLLRSRVFSIHD